MQEQNSISQETLKYISLLSVIADAMDDKPGASAASGEALYSACTNFLLELAEAGVSFGHCILDPDSSHSITIWKKEAWRFPGVDLFSAAKVLLRYAPFYIYPSLSTTDPQGFTEWLKVQKALKRFDALLH